MPSLTESPWMIYPLFAPHRKIKDMQLATMLPGPVFFENLTYRWAVIVSRVICKYLPKFQHLQKSVITHIPHKYSSEMSEKSTVVTFCSWLILKINGNTVVLHWAIKNMFKLILFLLITLTKICIAVPKILH
jgi:hypothetical protein